MKKLMKISVIILFIILSAGGSWAGLPCTGTTVTSPRGSISPGMSKAKVAAMWGKPNAEEKFYAVIRGYSQYVTMWSYEGRSLGGLTHYMQLYFVNGVYVCHNYN